MSPACTVSGAAIDSHMCRHTHSLFASVYSMCRGKHANAWPWATGYEIGKGMPCTTAHKRSHTRILFLAHCMFPARAPLACTVVHHTAQPPDANGIVVVTLDHYPVNSLSSNVYNGCTRAIKALEKDPSVRGVVLPGAGRM